MSETLERVRQLAAQGLVRLSDHGFERLFKHDIEYKDVLMGVTAAVVVEDYLEYVHGPSVLTLQYDSAARPLHVLWGFPRDVLDVAVVVTAYRPDGRWDRRFLKRK